MLDQAAPAFSLAPPSRENRARRPALMVMPSLLLSQSLWQQYRFVALVCDFNQPTITQVTGEALLSAYLFLSVVVVRNHKPLNIYEFARRCSGLWIPGHDAS